MEQRHELARQRRNREFEAEDPLWVRQVLQKTDADRLRQKRAEAEAAERETREADRRAYGEKKLQKWLRQYKARGGARPKPKQTWDEWAAARHVQLREGVEAFYRDLEVYEYMRVQEAAKASRAAAQAAAAREAAAAAAASADPEDSASVPSTEVDSSSDECVPLFVIDD